MGTVRRASEAATAEGARREHHQQSYEGAGEPKEPAANPESKCGRY